MKHFLLCGILFLAASACVASDTRNELFLSVEKTPAPILTRLRALHGEILGLKKEYPELGEFDERSLSRDRPILSFSHNMTYVRPAGAPRGYQAFGEQGCSISVEVMPPKVDGWPGGHGGPAWRTGRIALADGYHLSYSIGTKNLALQTALVTTIKRSFQEGPTKARWACAWRNHD